MLVNLYIFSFQPNEANHKKHSFGLTGMVGSGYLTEI